MLPLCARRASVVDKALVKEAKRCKKSLADLFRDLITYGLPVLPASEYLSRLLLCLANE